MLHVDDGDSPFGEGLSGMFMGAAGGLRFAARLNDDIVPSWRKRTFNLTGQAHSLLLVLMSEGGTEVRGKALEAATGINGGNHLSQAFKRLAQLGAVSYETIPGKGRQVTVYYETATRLLETAEVKRSNRHG